MRKVCRASRISEISRKRLANRARRIDGSRNCQYLLLFDKTNCVFYSTVVAFFLPQPRNSMRRGLRITLAKEDEIIAALEATPNATQVAREVGVSFATVWRRAERAGIELTAGKAARGYKRLTPEQYARIIAVREAMPNATQEVVARAAGVSRPTVCRVTRGFKRGAKRSPF
jgi:DNA-binding XRE family transcriptional regulator